MKRACVILLLLCGGAASAATPTDRKISIDQAEALVFAALNANQRKLPKLEADPDAAPSASRFMYFMVTWAGTEDGSVVVGNYTVDASTGDVFSSTRECYEEKNDKLSALQAQVRASIRLSPSEYRRIKTRGPLCGE